MPTESFADNAGIRIRYLHSEPQRPSGLPVVFVPGMVDSADEYLEAFECFGDRRLLIVELRGRGGSDAPHSGYSVEAQASDIEAVLDASGVSRFHLMTFSRGTTPALVLAFGSPDRVASISIGDYVPGEVGLPDDFAERMSALTWRGKSNSTRVPRHVFEGVQVDSRHRELWGELADLAVPVLVATGTDEGLFVDEECADRYRRLVPGVEVHRIEGSGHDLFRPSRTAYPNLLLDFLRRRLPDD